jgi:hypothetical protein
MLMSVYRQRQPRMQFDHIDCITGASSETDISLIGLAISHSRPVLIGLDGANTIIKPSEEGDDKHSFESLFDVSLTVHDLNVMKRKGVTDPNKIPPDLYKARLNISIELPPELRLQIPVLLNAQEQGEVRGIFNEFLENDPHLREAILEAVEKKLTAFITDVTRDNMRFAMSDAERQDGEKPLPDGTKWAMADDDD